MKRITRKRFLTPKEVEADNLVRKAIMKEFPPEQTDKCEFEGDLELDEWPPYTVKRLRVHYRRYQGSETWEVYPLPQLIIGILISHRFTGGCYVELPDAWSRGNRLTFDQAEVVGKMLTQCGEWARLINIGVRPSFKQSESVVTRSPKRKKKTC